MKVPVETKKQHIKIETMCVKAQKVSIKGKQSPDHILSKNERCAKRVTEEAAKTQPLMQDKGKLQSHCITILVFRKQ